VSRTIYLIVEDETDAEVVRAILAKKNSSLRISHLKPAGNSGGLSRLAEDLEKLIKTAIQKRKKGDCIAVLHDADLQTQQNRKAYDEIKKICQKYQQYVRLILAVDEIESWLLADEGLCAYLGEKPRNCDMETRPSDRLKTSVHRKTQKHYQGKTRSQVLSNVDGTGDKHSPSMQKAIAALIEADCLKS
jgi:hypothetical protein